MNTQTKTMIETKNLPTKEIQSPILYLTETVGRNHLLHSFYEKHQGSTSESKILISVVNAILTHKLIFFAVTDEQILSVVKNDINWKLNSRFKLHEVRNAIDDMISTGMIEIFVKGDDSRETLYAVSCPEILNEIDPSESDIKANQEMVLDWLKQNYK